MRAEAIRYLNKAGFDFKSAESPDLWTHLESHFFGKQPVGSKFNPLSATAISEMILKGEEALLDALVLQHRRTGSLAPVTQVLDLPYVVGSDSTISAAQVNGYEALTLIDQPGTAAEHLVHILPADKQSIPSTRQATIRGGVYPDGHTVGFFDLSPGNHGDEGSAASERVYLATPEEIVSLAKEMETSIDTIALVTEAECNAMIARAKRLLGG